MSLVRKLFMEETNGLGFIGLIICVYPFVRSFSTMVYKDTWFSKNI